MIQEAYVSLETSKLLKKKGFDVSTRYCYGNERAYRGRLIDFDTECELKAKGLGGKIKNVMIRQEMWWTKDCDYLLPCPTQQMAMSWLRITHSLHIETPHVWLPLGYKYAIIRLDKGIFHEIHQNDVFESCEDAVEAAIQYCLTNLV